MKTNIICWLPESFYHNEECKQLLIENNIVPLLDSNYSQDIWEAQGKPDWALRHISYLPYENDGLVRSDIICYKDEPISTNQYEGLQSAFKLLCKSVNAIVGETSTETIQQLIDAGCKSITYTAYGLHLFRLFNINFRLDFISQVYTWDRIMKKHPDKFHFNWIMLDKPNRFKHLIEWCVKNSNTILLSAPDSKQNNPEWIYNQLTKFINVYKEVTDGN